MKYWKVKYKTLKPFIYTAFIHFFLFFFCVVK